MGIDHCCSHITVPQKFPGDTAKHGTPTGFNRLIKIIKRKKWSGFAKSPCSGPQKVLEYLGHTHKVAISNYRIKSFEKGKLYLDDLAKLAAKNGEPKQISGKQELLESLINQQLNN